MPRPRISSKTTAEELRAWLEGSLQFIWQHHGGADKAAARTIAVEVLGLLQQHLNELGIDRSLTRPLKDIQSAFIEAERGRLVPLFEPEPLTSRPPIEIWKLYVRGKAALAMDLLMMKKVSRKEAARRVASELRKLGVPIYAKQDVQDWKTVQGWREELAKAGGGAGWHHPDWDFFGSIYLMEREAVLGWVNSGELDPEEEASRQLNRIPKSLPTIG